jgi:hypothetical protein
LLAKKTIVREMVKEILLQWNPVPKPVAIQQLVQAWPQLWS